MLKLLPFLLFFSHLSAFVVGNFADTTFYQNGFTIKGSQIASVRTGYVADYLYKISMKNEFLADELELTDFGFSTYASYIGINFIDLLDLYAILGSTKITSDELGFVPRKFSWCVGGKATILKFGKFTVGGDLKYFETVQKPSFYVLEDGEPAFVINKLNFTYKEIQAALGMTYDLGCIIPYAGATYLSAKLEPNVHFVVLDIPAFGGIFEDDNLKSNVNESKWGFVWGITLLASRTVSLSVESRHIDQNDVNVIGEFRF